MRLAYKILKPIDYYTPYEASLFSMQQWYTEIRDAFVDSKSGWRVFDNSTRANYAFVFWRDGRVHGEIFFEIRGYKLISQRLGKYCVRPHAYLSEEAAGLGLATSMYMLALEKGLTLITPGHTKKASYLWDRLACKATLDHYYVAWSGKSTVKANPLSLRVLTHRS